tara:strand:- start:1637 stop:2296 length:660 start_codon:yes stop_codon:yes gene_type:complete
MALTLCTFYTPSHEILFKEWLLPSATSAGFVVEARKYDNQLCATGNYAETGWRDTQFKKLSNYISVLKRKKDTDIIVGSDVDVQIIKPCENKLVEFLGDCDLAFQENVDGKVCSGFFVARCNSNVINFFETALKSLACELMKSKKGGGEQYEIWKLIANGNHNAKLKMLPKNEVWNPRTKYEKVEDLNIPTNMLVHHANWTHGTKNKIKQLAFVWEKLS